MSPVGPTRSDWQDHRVHKGALSQVLEDPGVFVVLNAVPDGLQTNPGSRLSGDDRTRWIEENSVARSAQATTASGRIHVVPTANGVPGGPSVGAVVKKAGGALGPIQEAGLDA